MTIKAVFYEDGKTIFKSKGKKKKVKEEIDQLFKFKV